MWKKAGFDVNRIMEYHGSMDYLQGLTKKGPIYPVAPVTSMFTKDNPKE